MKIAPLVAVFVAVAVPVGAFAENFAGEPARAQSEARSIRSSPVMHSEFAPRSHWGGGSVNWGRSSSFGYHHESLPYRGGVESFGGGPGRLYTRGFVGSTAPLSSHIIVFNKYTGQVSTRIRDASAPEG